MSFLSCSLHIQNCNFIFLLLILIKIFFIVSFHFIIMIWVTLRFCNLAPLHVFAHLNLSRRWNLTRFLVPFGHQAGVMSVVPDNRILIGDYMTMATPAATTS